MTIRDCISGTLHVDGMDSHLVDLIASETVRDGRVEFIPIHPVRKTSGGRPSPSRRRSITRHRRAA